MVIGPNMDALIANYLQSISSGEISFKNISIGGWTVENGLAALQYILRGSVSFRESENSTTDLLDGIAKFHVLVSPPPPARDIDFIMEYDAEAMTVLFE